MGDEFEPREADEEVGEVEDEETEMGDAGMHVEEAGGDEEEI